MSSAINNVNYMYSEYEGGNAYSTNTSSQNTENQAPVFHESEFEVRNGVMIDTSIDKNLLELYRSFGYNVPSIEDSDGVGGQDGVDDQDGVEGQNGSNEQYSTDEENEKFGFFEGLGAFVKGIFTKGVGNIVKTVVEHPVMTGLGVLASAAAVIAFPVAGPAVLGVLAAGSAVKAVADGIGSAHSAAELYEAGEYDAALEEIENAGGDAFTAGVSCS